MQNQFIIKTTSDNIDWIAAANIFFEAPLGTREPSQLKKTFENSQEVCFIFHDENIIGLGRAISDQTRSAAIYDIVVLPSYQGKGIGSKIMESLLSRLDGYSITLYSVPGKELFYAKFGFRVLKTSMGILSERLQKPEIGYVSRPEDFIQTQKWEKKEYTISTDPLKLQIDVIHNFLKNSYWAKNIPLEIFKKSLQHSLTFGVYRNSSQIGFARVITDYATFAYIGDVFIIDSYQGQGLGKWLMQCILSHQELQNLRNWNLATADAHGLYQKFGFKTPESPSKYMEIKNNNIYM